MPTSPKKPCKHPGCPELTSKSYCPQHSRLHEKQRGYPSVRGYGGKWQAIRKRCLSLNPLCTDCLEQRRTTVATEVHHVMPVRDGGSNEESNLIALCKSCHSKHTAREGGFGRNIVYRM